ncbi:hypothetical protein [Fervidibacillus albus]|uniref:Uncharacterized protein n=1 Tax=Fervidibacillus albus TaxID=2980026 RepID=A0A9E8LWT5_9BACI|nr:hypothetical protein [Fervidibacillus albus]WAA11127.1 hypothetical protein OE104_07470 [Fervidibacillus albus]
MDIDKKRDEWICPMTNDLIIKMIGNKTENGYVSVNESIGVPNVWVIHVNRLVPNEKKQSVSPLILYQLQKKRLSFV